VRVVCNHAGEKKSLIDKILGVVRQCVVREPNTFASTRSHNWVWHYQLHVPRQVQAKPQQSSQVAQGPPLSQE
jgi:hypothetical protein